ncbi:hypothetical protein ACIA5C_04010 [Actinoplanes sp. NPDC051343]|uniref:hypothetical protein n=1 Tax=Actinoplanes sp. NPDC051343 TaxID=3363906 RepID=UPI0037ABE13A
MGFFDDRPLPPPPPEPPRRRRPVWDRPEAAVGGVAPGEFLVARSDEAAVAVSGFRAFPNGFEMTLTVLLRRDDQWRHGRVFQQLHEGPEPGAPLPDEFLRFGVLFADGTSATNLGGRHIAPDASVAPPMLMQRGGGGGGRRFDLGYWVWPLPPPGPMTLVVEWPARGITESRAEVDTQPILEAASRAIQVFDEDEDEDAN